jgi:hypothetical protein
MHKFEIGTKFYNHNLIMVIKQKVYDKEFIASTEPKKNYKVEFYDKNNININNINIPNCVNYKYEDETYVYYINERILCCDYNIKQIYKIDLFN